MHILLKMGCGASSAGSQVDDLKTPLVSYGAGFLLPSPSISNVPHASDCCCCWPCGVRPPPRPAVNEPDCVFSHVRHAFAALKVFGVAEAVAARMRKPLQVVKDDTSQDPDFRAVCAQMLANPAMDLTLEMTLKVKELWGLEFATVAIVVRCDVDGENMRLYNPVGAPHVVHFCIHGDTKSLHDSFPKLEFCTPSPGGGSTPLFLHGGVVRVSKEGAGRDASQTAGKEEDA